MNDSLMGNASVKRVLDGLINPAHPVPPRALIVDADSEPLWDSGDTTLPLALTGITKLFTLAMVLREIDRGALSLDTTLGEVLPADTVRGLCVVGTIPSGRSNNNSSNTTEDGPSTKRSK